MPPGAAGIGRPLGVYRPNLDRPQPNEDTALPPAVSQTPEELTGTAAPAANPADGEGRPHRFRVADYAVILKPRVMSLVVFTALVGLLLAPGTIDPLTATIAVACIAIGAGASGAVNMWYDQDIDRTMRRTMHRPIPAGRMRPFEALIVGIVLSVASVVAMTWFVIGIVLILLFWAIAVASKLVKAYGKATGKILTVLKQARSADKFWSGWMLTWTEA